MFFFTFYILSQRVRPSRHLVVCSVFILHVSLTLSTYENRCCRHAQKVELTKFGGDHVYKRSDSPPPTLNHKSGLESEESWIKCLGTLEAVYICLQPETKPPKTMELSTSTCEAVTHPIRAGYLLHQ